MAGVVLVYLDWLLAAVLFTITVVLAKVNFSVQKKKEILGNLPTYPGGLPIIGHAHLALRFTYSGFVDELMRTRKENKGSLHIWLGPKLCGYVGNPSDIENILNRKDALNKGHLFNFFQAHSVGLLSNTTPRWFRMRKMANIPLAHKQMIDGFINVFQEQSRVVMSVLAEHEGKDYFDIYPYLSRCCQDITYESHFGVKLDIQHNEHLCAQESVSQSIALVFERMMKVWLYPDFIYFRTNQGKTLKKYIEHNHNIAKKIIEERKRVLKEENKILDGNVLKKNMTKLLDVYLDKQSGLTEEEIKHEILDIMLAGFETMSLTQSWVLLLLAMYPEYQKRVHEELDLILGDVEDITLEDLQKCHLLDMVAKEALRLFGLPIVIRQLTQNVPIENYTLPADSEMIVGMCFVHRDPRYWERPDSFYPEHFLPEKVADRHKYAFLPFGGGPRKCPAYAYGMVTVKFITAALLRKYRFTTNQDFNNLPLDLFFMYKPADGFLLKYERRC